MVLLGELLSLGRHETDLWRELVTSWHPSANGCLGTLGVRFSIKVLTDKSGDVSIIPRDVLLTHLVGGSTDPVGSVAAAIAKDVLERLVAWSHVLQGVLLIELESGGSLSSVVVVSCSSRGRVEIFDDHFVHITGSHTEAIDLGGNVACVARHVLFVEVHLAVARAE